MSRKKTISNDKIRKSRILKALLISKNYTEKDLRIECILMFCEYLLKEFLKDNAKRTNVLNLKEMEEAKIRNLDFEDDTKDKFDIINEAKIIQEYLKENILTVEKFDTLFKKFVGQNSMPFHVTILEPYRFYFNKLSRLMDGKIKQNQDDSWMPELLAFSLINNLKIEKEFSFSRYCFLNDYDFDKLLEQYNKVNLKLKRYKQNNSEEKKSIFKINTIIDEMEEVAFMLADKIVNLKYIS